MARGRQPGHRQDDGAELEHQSQPRDDAPGARCGRSALRGDRGLAAARHHRGSTASARASLPLPPPAPRRPAKARGPRAGRRPHRRWRLQQLGRLGRAHALRQAAAGQRSALAAHGPLHLVSRPPGARAAGGDHDQCRGRDAGRRAPRPARPHRHPGVGLHQHRPRRAGRLHREDQPRRPEALSGARRLAAVRDRADGDHRQGRRRAHPGAPPHAPRARPARLLPQSRGAARARVRGGAAMDGAHRRRHDDRCRRVRPRHPRRPRLHGPHAPVRRADAEHGAGRRGRQHRHDRPGASAGARPRQQGGRPRARSGLGCDLRLEGLPEVRGPAARREPAGRRHRHGQCPHRRARLSPPPHLRLGDRVPPAAHQGARPRSQRPRRGKHARGAGRCAVARFRAAQAADDRGRPPGR